MSDKKQVPTVYRKMPVSDTQYLAFVVVVSDPLNFHLDIYWPREMRDRYSSAISYEYTFMSEELLSGQHTRKAYTCHLNDIELDYSSSTNTKEAYILSTKRIFRMGGWVIVSVSDIDIYRRILVTIHDVIDRSSINDMLLNYVSPSSGKYIAGRYRQRATSLYKPSPDVPPNYHIVYN